MSYKRIFTEFRQAGLGAGHLIHVLLGEYGCRWRTSPQLWKSRAALFFVESLLFFGMCWAQGTMHNFILVADLGSFTESFLASLLSGLIYSIIVGLAIVWAIDRNRCQREIASVREGLRSRLFRPSPWNGINAMDCAPPGAVAVSDLLDKYAIDLWGERLPEEMNFIRALNAFQAAYSEFLTAASVVEATLDQLIRSAIEQQAIIPAYRDVVEARALYIYHLRGRVEAGADDLGVLPVVATSIDNKGINFDPVVNVPPARAAMINLLQSARTCRHRLDAIRLLLA